MNKFLIFSDLHVKESLIDYQVKLLDYIYSYAFQNGISNVIFLGDFFDKKNYIRSSIIKRLFDVLDNVPSDIDSYYLLGNHDLGYKTKYDESQLEVLRNYVTVISQPSIYSIIESNVYFYFMPYRSEKQILNYLSEFYKRMLELNGESKHIYFGHHGLKIKYSIYDGLIDESSIDHNYLKNFDLCFLGHIHLGKQLHNIQVLNTVMHKSFSEENVTPGFYVFTMNDDNTFDLEFMENKITPRFVTVDYSELNKLDNYNNSNYFVRIVVHNKAEKKILEKLENIGSTKIVYKPDKDSSQKETDIKNATDYLLDYIKNRYGDKSKLFELAIKYINNL